MDKRYSGKPSTTKVISTLQLLFIFLAWWGIFWAHVYPITVLHKTFLESALSSIDYIVLYSVSILAVIYIKIYTKQFKGVTASEESRVSLENLRKQNEFLKRELLKSRQTPSSKIGLGFLLSGAALLVTSYLTSSQVLAFIGLGLAFWGGLFLFTRPSKFVSSAVLNSTAISSYVTIDRVTDDLNYKGKPIYVPPYPKGAYLPEYLRGLKEMVVYVPPADIVAVPTIEELAKKQFILKNPQGICIPPPGYGLISLIEGKLRNELTQIDTDRLFNNLPTIIITELELAREFEINEENGLIHVKITDSVFKDLYSAELDLRSIHSIGCPLTSAIACTLAKTTGKLVTLDKDSVSSDLQSIEVWYKTLEA
jgi:hypothetical protein